MSDELKQFNPEGYNPSTGIYVSSQPLQVTGKMN